jgi:hypothetical protein
MVAVDSSFLPAARLLLASKRAAEYFGFVIRSFRDKETEAIFNGDPVLKFQNIATVARRKLRSIHQARTCEICRCYQVTGLRR